MQLRCLKYDNFSINFVIIAIVALLFQRSDFELRLKYYKYNKNWIAKIIKRLLKNIYTLYRRKINRTYLSLYYF